MSIVRITEVENGFVIHYEEGYPYTNFVAKTFEEACQIMKNNLEEKSKIKAEQALTYSGTPLPAYGAQAEFEAKKKGALRAIKEEK